LGIFDPKEEETREASLFSLRRIRTLIVGAVCAAILGLLLVNAFMYLQYGGTMFDRFFVKEETKSPAAGKLAFDKGTKYYIGIIKREGHTARLGDVYYVEQVGGGVIEISKANVEVRDPVPNQR